MQNNTTHQLTINRPSQLTKERQVSLFLAVANRYGWSFPVLGNAPMPNTPIRLDKWLILPATADTSPLPQSAYRKVETLFREGVRPKGFVIVHEAPMVLPAPVAVPEVTWSAPFKPVSDGSSIMAFVETFATGLANLMSAAVPFLLLPGLLLLDPILIAVTEDDTWIEIERWNIEAR